LREVPFSGLSNPGIARKMLNFAIFEIKYYFKGKYNSGETFREEILEPD